jgi:hypothetical protein
VFTHLFGPLGFGVRAGSMIGAVAGGLIAVYAPVERSSFS